MVRLQKQVQGETLADRYELEDGRVFLSGIQALVRLPIEQMRRDRRTGLRTRAFITGYPGSPLGGYDIALGQVQATLDKYGIIHLPGQNEELAATTLMGTQMLDQHPHPDVDGVVAYWYGKGSGLDRSGDALKHGNFAGTSTHGAVVILSGEDHEAKSSSVPYQQDFAFEHLGIPVLYPASVQEFIEYGVHAAALSRYSGCFVALKLVGPLCDGGEVVPVSTDALVCHTPQLSLNGKPFRKQANFNFFPVLNIETERQLYSERHEAVRAYAQANALNRITVRGSADRIGIISAGKSYNDTRQALQDLGFDEAALHQAGIRLAKIGLLCPLDALFVRDFARGLTKIIVIEEKRDFLQRQIASAICDLGPMQILGKKDSEGRPLFPVEGGINSDIIAALLGRQLLAEMPLPESGDARLAELVQIQERDYGAQPKRTLNFCSGCPHNVSLKLAPGQIAWGAPGCHIFAALLDQPDKRIEAVTQLGGEGLPWIGLAPYTTRKHIVQNLGDGALMHSSYQNIRFAVSAGVNITFKILFNGVIANTGGQPSIGSPGVEALLRHLALEGVAKIVLIAKEPARYRGVSWPGKVVMRDVAALEDSMKELESIAGTTVLLYDGECANERRRRQKRGRLPAPTRYTVVNEDVCENCGDCGRVANCMSLQKITTEFGAKTQIHQSSCNQDEACVRGECPSFVTLEAAPGSVPRRPAVQVIDVASLPAARLPELLRPYSIYIPGLGGTGVLTANAILAQAVAFDGNEAKSYDQTGAAQKWGAVLSSLVVAPPNQAPITNRVGLARADVYLALDLLAGVDRNNLNCCNGSSTAAVINTGLLPSGEMVRNSQLVMPLDEMVQTIRSATRGEDCVVLDARRIAEGLFGDYMMANMVAIGAAYQAGLLPITADSIERAIELNGTQVAANILAFRAGRLSQSDAARLAPMIARPYVALANRLEDAGSRNIRLAEIMALVSGIDGPADAALKSLVELRARDLTGYQNTAYAKRFVLKVAEVAKGERSALGAASSLAITAAVARNLHKLMAYKDEYEVARLLTQATFAQRIEQMFTGRVRMVFHLQPPLIRRFYVKQKLAIGPWIKPLMRGLAAFRFLRGTAFDPFGYLAMRRKERQLLAWYLALVEEGMRCLTPENSSTVCELLSLPEQIRGYETVKEKTIRTTEERAAELTLRLRTGHRQQAGAS